MGQVELKEKITQKCRKKIDFIISHGMNYLDEDDYIFISDMDRWIAKNWTVSWRQQKRIGRLYRFVEDKIG